MKPPFGFSKLQFEHYLRCFSKIQVGDMLEISNPVYHNRNMMAQVVAIKSDYHTGYYAIDRNSTFRIPAILLKQESYGDAEFGFVDRDHFRAGLTPLLQPLVKNTSVLDCLKFLGTSMKITKIHKAKSVPV